jgi:helix-turn-helix protein
MGKRNIPAVTSPVTLLPAVNTDELYLMDIPTAARLLSTTVFAVRELMRSGELVKVEIGHKWLVSHDAIRAFIRRKEQEATKAA